MWQKLKPKKYNMTIKQMSKLSITTMVEIRYELDIIVLEVNNQMAIIQVQVGKNIVEDVLIDGGASVKIITENLRTKLGLSKRRLVRYHLKMADQSMTRPLGIIQKLKIHICDIPYIATFIVLKKQCGRF